MLKLTWTDRRKINSYCVHKVEVAQIHLPPSTVIRDRIVVERRGTHRQICSVSVAIHGVISIAICNCSALGGFFARRCIFYSNKQKAKYQTETTLNFKDNIVCTKNCNFGRIF